MLHQTRIQHLAEKLTRMKEPPLTVAELGEGEYVLVVDGAIVNDAMNEVRLLTWDWTMENKGEIVPEDWERLPNGEAQVT